MRHRSLGLLARRMWVADRRRNVALGLTFAVALGAIIMVGFAGVSVADRIARRSNERYGTARIFLPSQDTGLAGGGGWIASSQVARIAQILTIEDVSVHPRVEVQAVLHTGNGESIITVISGEGADANNDAGPAIRTGTVLLPLARPLDRQTDIGGYLDLSAAGLAFHEIDGGTQAGPFLTRGLLGVLRDAGIAPKDAAANVLEVSATAARNPSVVAFNARELLEGEFPGIQVISRTELAGPAALISSGNISLLVRMALLLPALAALIGAVLVGVESRSGEIVLLHAMGFSVQAIQGLLVRESLLVAGTATFLAVSAGLILGAAVPFLAVTSAPLVNAMILGLLVPPALTFLVVRRVLSRRLHDRMAEARG